MPKFKTSANLLTVLILLFSVFSLARSLNAQPEPAREELQRQIKELKDTQKPFRKNFTK